jgi:hypothetical protein
VADTIALPLRTGPIGNFELTILNALPDTAGSIISVRVVAKDAFGNFVVSSSQYQMSAIGSSTAQFLPSSIYTFSNDYADTISVRDTTAGSFSVKAQLTANPSKQGTSPSIEIIPATPNSLVFLSPEDSITVGTSRLLRVSLKDIFSNNISDSLVTFELLNGIQLFGIVSPYIWVLWQIP